MQKEQLLRPFFIVGSPRSGTTLLRFMLSSHSGLHVPDETGFIPFLNHNPNQPLSKKTVDGLLRRIGRLNRFWKDVVVDSNTFYDSLPQPCLPFVLDALFRCEGNLPETVRWGDKTPLYVRYIPQILAIFPQAQFIHVIRDGRDATLSAYEKWGRYTWYMDHYYLLRNWQRNVQAGVSAQQQLSSKQFFTVYYEQLVEYPKKSLQEVIMFLGEQFEPDVLQHTSLAKKAGGGIDRHIEVQDPTHQRSVKRWQHEMTLFERKMADQLIGDSLLKFGYPLANEGSLKGIEWVKAKILGLKYLLTNTTRTFLYKIGILTLNRNRR